MTGISAPHSDEQRATDPLRDQPNRSAAVPLSGIIPPLVTPLLTPERLDVVGLERLVDHLISGGVHGLFILGTTGEGPSLSQSLRRELITRVTTLAAGRLPDKKMTHLSPTFAFCASISSVDIPLPPAPDNPAPAAVNPGGKSNSPAGSMERMCGSYVVLIIFGGRAEVSACPARGANWNKLDVFVHAKKRCAASRSTLPILCEDPVLCGLHSRS